MWSDVLGARQPGDTGRLLLAASDSPGVASAGAVVVTPAGPV